jgi:hypothetical protein
MSDLAEMFQDGPHGKGSYLSRIFGIFNEEIVRIWALDPHSPYDVLDRRPTLYESGRFYTLDFLFQKGRRHFVAEMKCEVEYRNYRFWRLAQPEQLDHHKKKKAFQLFLRLSKDASAVLVKAGEPIQVHGTILVWGAATPEGIKAVKDQYGFSDVLTVERCIEDLVSWKNKSYLQLLQEREEWSSSLFHALRGKSDA